MLSCGKYYKQVPKQTEKNYEFRRDILKRASKDKAFQKGVIEACEQDLLFWINTFAWQFNVKKAGCEVAPFITYPFQDRSLVFGDKKKDELSILQAVEWVNPEIRGQIGCDLLIEKSREMGISWEIILAFDWMYLFHRNKSFIMVSLSADAVDKPGDPKSLFWKLDFIHDHLPDWMVKPRVHRRKFSLDNPVNGSTIVGEASTGRIGVGGRATAILIDEFSQIKEDFEVFHRTADVSNCRIFNFTHTGIGTCAYEISHTDAGKGIRKQIIHWSEHPDKNAGLYRSDGGKGVPIVIDKKYKFPRDFEFVLDGSPSGPYYGIRSPWYDFEVKRRGSPQAVAMDLDIDPMGSSKQFFGEELIRQLKTLCVAPVEYDLEYDRRTGVPVRLVARKGGLIRCWCPLQDGKPAYGFYGAGIDVSAGQGATPSCLTMSHGETGSKILEFCDANIEPRPFAVLAVALCRLFHGAKLAWENRGPGTTFGKVAFTELRYVNVYYRTDELDFTREKRDFTKPGWAPESGNKRRLLEEYRTGLSTGQFTNKSVRSFDELRAFSYDQRGNVVHGKEKKSSDPSGANENHADLVISDALSYKMVKDICKHLVAAEMVALPNSVAWRHREYEAELALCEDVVWE